MYRTCHERELAQALARLDRYAPLTVAIILLAGGLTKVGHAGWGVSLIAGCCILFSGAAQLWAHARTKAGSRPLGPRIEVSEFVRKSIWNLLSHWLA